MSRSSPVAQPPLPRARRTLFSEFMILITLIIVPLAVAIGWPPGARIGTGLFEPAAAGCLHQHHEPCLVQFDE